MRMVQLQKARPAFCQLFQYDRPSDIPINPIGTRTSGPSFPSGHTANNTVIALCLHACFIRDAGWLLLDCHVAVRLFADLSRRALAERCHRDFLPGRRRSAARHCVLELLWKCSARGRPRLFARHPSIARRLDHDL